MDRNEYEQLLKETVPKTNHAKNCFFAFLFGGLICMFGEVILDIITMGLKVTDPKQSAAYTSMILIIIASILTGLGLYDRMGHLAGAGTIVPITGFANSIVSPAMEYNREGIIFGVMSKMFVIAGPVIVSGVSVSILIGFIYLIFGV